MEYNYSVTTPYGVYYTNLGGYTPQFFLFSAHLVSFNIIALSKGLTIFAIDFLLTCV